MDNSTVEHIPVLAETLAKQVSLPPDAVIVDATVGQGGHSSLFGQFLGPKATIIGFDADEKSIQQAKIKLSPLPCRVILLRSNFSQITQQLHNQQIETVDFILADLGLSSAQLVDTERGLSFQTNMPLDMRIDKRLKTTAADIINSADKKTLADLIYKFGQDRKSRRIADFIVEYRRTGKITTTGQLAAVICRAVGRQKSRIHPATRTFQALRIAVNNELENLQCLLDQAPAILNKNGQIAVISYHSLEDKLVKENFRANKKEGIYQIITKKPIVPSRNEIAENRRARSAKLRIAQK